MWLSDIDHRYKRVVGDPAAWRADLLRDDVLPLFDWQLKDSIKSTCAVAAVPKTAKGQLRNIMAVVPKNTRCAPPPRERSLGLNGIGVLRRVVAPGL